MNLEEAVEAGVAYTVEVVEQTLHNRNQRLAKTIVVSCVEFLVAVASILAGVINEVNESNGSDGDSYVFSLTYFVVAVTMLYVAVVAIIIFATSRRLKPHARLDPEIDLLYAATNKMICIDGILEIPLSIKYAGRCIPIFMWSVYLLLLILVMMAMFYVPEGSVNQTSAQTYVASFLAVIQMYRITSDVCEFWFT